MIEIISGSMFGAKCPQCGYVNIPTRKVNRVEKVGIICPNCGEVPMIDSCCDWICPRCRYQICRGQTIIETNKTFTKDEYEALIKDKKFSEVK